MSVQILATKAIERRPCLQGDLSPKESGARLIIYTLVVRYEYLTSIVIRIIGKKLKKHVCLYMSMKRTKLNVNILSQVTCYGLGALQVASQYVCLSRCCCCPNIETVRVTILCSS